MSMAPIALQKRTWLQAQLIGGAAQGDLDTMVLRDLAAAVAAAA